MKRSNLQILNTSTNYIRDIHSNFFIPNIIKTKCTSISKEVNYNIPGTEDWSKSSL